MDKIEKALAKLTAAERMRVKKALAVLLGGKMMGLDVKKLKGHSDIFRLRIGNLRVIYQKKKEKVFILIIARRSEKTYKIS
jgi:mRNA interferase RelE/StbE